MLAVDIHPRMNGASFLPPSPSPFPTSAGSARVPSIISLAADKLTIIVKCPRIATRPISELAFARARVPCSRARFTAAFKHDVYFMTSLTPCARPSVRPSLPTPSSTRPFAFGPRAAIRSPRHAGGWCASKARTVLIGKTAWNECPRPLTTTINVPFDRLRRIWHPRVCYYGSKADALSA